MDEVGRVRPVLSLLAGRFGEATHYARLDGSEVVYVAKTQSPGAGLQITSVIGGPEPPHITPPPRRAPSCALAGHDCGWAHVPRPRPPHRPARHPPHPPTAR